ncbi:MAG: HAD-IIIC family phosphatase [Phycisphaerae bacterium]
MPPTAAQAVLDRVHQTPTLVNIAGAAAQINALRASLARVTARVACLSSFTFDPLKPALELQALRAGLAIDTYVAPFGRYEQELIDPASGLSGFAPDVVLMAVRLQETCGALYEAFNSLNREQAEKLVDDWLARLAAALQTFRSRSDAYFLVQNYDLPAAAALGIADGQAEPSQAAIIRRANDGLAELAASLGNAFVMDYDALVAREGRRHWSDPRTAFYARIPVAPEHYWALTGFYVRHLRPLFGLSKKVLVLDADNTLWGGVVGDAGLHGIALGQDYPGNAFVAFQKRVLDLYHRGVVLALASKNEPGSVEEVLERHPDMVLRAEHFAAMQINWDPKPDNVRRIAADLNLGLDSFLFLDDSPVECEMMRTALPQVATILLPDDPAAYASVVESLDCFDQWKLSAEDRRRGALYKAEAGRRAFQRETVDMPTFYHRLEMRMTLFVDNPAHVVRAAQMTRRTNQFNMHTIRCTEDDIRRFMDADDCEVVTLALRDRFGDNGVVGLAILRRAEAEWILHMFLMSCRVLGRTVEQTFIRWIAGRARDAGARRLVAEFVPTSKNKPFAGFYQDCGFHRSDSSGEAQRWTWELEAAETAPPDWMQITLQSEAE